LQLQIQIVLTCRPNGDQEWQVIRPVIIWNTVSVGN